MQWKHSHNMFWCFFREPLNTVPNLLLIHCYWQEVYYMWCSHKGRGLVLQDRQAGEWARCEKCDGIWNLKTRLFAKQHFHTDHRHAQWCFKKLLTEHMLVRMTCPGRLIYCSASITHPAHLPHLVVLDYFLWGYAQIKVRKICLASVDDFKNSEFGNVFKESLKNA